MTRPLFFCATAFALSLTACVVPVEGDVESEDVTQSTHEVVAPDECVPGKITVPLSRFVVKRWKGKIVTVIINSTVRNPASFQPVALDTINVFERVYDKSKCYTVTLTIGDGCTIADIDFIEVACSEDSYR